MWSEVSVLYRIVNHRLNVQNHWRKRRRVRGQKKVFKVDCVCRVTLPNMQVNLHHKDIFKSFSSSSGAGMNLFSSSWEAAATLRFFLIRCLFHRLRRRPAARSDCPSFAIWFEHHGAKQISSKLFPESKMKAFISLCGARRWQPTEAHTQRWIHGSEKCDKLQQKQHWFDPTRPVEWYESEFCKEEKEVNQQSHSL